MTKPTRQITNCEYCDKQIDLSSPPSAEQYEEGQVHIGSGSMLLPSKIVEKKGIASSHAIFLDGYYCSKICLIQKIEAALK